MFLVHFADETQQCCVQDNEVFVGTFAEIEENGAAFHKRKYG